jgi:hypothetical protein
MNQYAAWLMISGVSVEAISEQDHHQIGRQPVGDHREYLLLRGEADGALGLFNPPGQQPELPLSFTGGKSRQRRAAFQPSN